MVNCSIELPTPYLSQILREADAALPRECCGLIEGTRLGCHYRIAAIYPARNIAEQIDRFSIDPADLFAASRRARSHGLGIIGCYHSHPTGVGYPSPHDLKGAGEENFLWLIAAAGQVSAFVYSRGAFGIADFTFASG